MNDKKYALHGWVPPVMHRATPITVSTGARSAAPRAAEIAWLGSFRTSSCS